MKNSTHLITGKKAIDTTIFTMIASANPQVVTHPHCAKKTPKSSTNHVTLKITKFIQKQLNQYIENFFNNDFIAETSGPITPPERSFSRSPYLRAIDPNESKRQAKTSRRSIKAIAIDTPYWGTILCTKKIIPGTQSAFSASSLTTPKYNHSLQTALRLTTREQENSVGLLPKASLPL